MPLVRIQVSTFPSPGLVCSPCSKLPQWLSGKESACQAGDAGSVPGSGRSPGGGRDNPLQYSCLENPMDRGAWWATVHSVTKNWTQLSNQHLHFPQVTPFYREESKYFGELRYFCKVTKSLSESESRSVVSNSLWPQWLYSSWNSPGHNTGVGSLSLLQGIFPTQQSNPGFLHCRNILYQLSHKGLPW